MFLKSYTKYYLEFESEVLHFLMFTWLFEYLCII